MAKAIFYDPQLKRWRRLRRVLDVVGIVITVVKIDRNQVRIGIELAAKPCQNCCFQPPSTATNRLKNATVEARCDVGHTAALPSLPQTWC